MSSWINWIRPIALKLLNKTEVARQLSNPKANRTGKLIAKFLEKNNAILEKKAVDLAEIQPDYLVLEVGFGPGLGLRYAADFVANGSGKICGVDISPFMVEKAEKHCALEIAEGKVDIRRGNVMFLPYLDNTFDRVFHCNVFYFWPDLIRGAKEIRRVMKAGGIMVTTLNLDSLKKLEAEGVLTPAVFRTTDPLNYMAALEGVGFADVRIEYYDYKDITYQGIFATKSSTDPTRRLDPDLEVEELKRVFKVASDIKAGREP